MPRSSVTSRTQRSLTRQSPAATNVPDVFLHPALTMNRPKVSSGECGMPGRPSHVYWDSSVPLAYINGDSGRLPMLDALLEELGASDGPRRIATSVAARQAALVVADSNPT